MSPTSRRLTPSAAPEVAHDSDAWRGGYYDLSFATRRRPGQLDKMIRALWGHPSLDGVWMDRCGEWTPRERIAPGLDEPDQQWYDAHGAALLPDGGRVPCRSYIVLREDGVDLLGFSVPCEALGRLYPLGAYPFNVLKDPLGVFPDHFPGAIMATP